MNLKVATLLLKDFEKSGVHRPLKIIEQFIQLNDKILPSGQKFSSNAYPFEETIRFENLRTSLRC
jgi:mitochondrial intermediate peptidase